MAKTDQSAAQRPEAANGAILTSSAAQAETNAIDQVRELLFGHEKRSADQRMQDFDDKIEALRADMMAHVSMLETRLAEAERALEAQHNAAIDEIGVAISDLGARVRKLVSSTRGR